MIERMAQELLGPYTERAIKELSSYLHEPEWLTRFRLYSYQNFLELPLERNPLYTKYTYVSNFELREFPFKVEKEMPDFRSFFKDYLTGKESNIILQANNVEIHNELDEDLLSSGVRLMPLHQAIIEHEQLMKELFQNKLVNSEGDKYAALVNSFFNSGTFIYIPRNVEVKRPIRRMLLIDNPECSVFEQVIIYADEGSRATFLEELYSKENQRRNLLGSIVELYSKDGSSIDFGSIQYLDDNITYLTNKNIACYENSRASISSIFLGSYITRSRMNLLLNGRGSSAEGFEIFFTSSKQRYDFESNLIHTAQDTTGSTQARGVLKGESQSVFKGMIKIVRQAKNSRSYLAHHAMILDRTAKSDGIPALEIDTNEVKATHSASVSQMDEEQVFYLMSRGLTYDEAKKMIVLGFFEPTLSRIPVDEARDGARFIIEGKWNGERRKLVDRETIIAITGEASLATKKAEDIFERHYKYRK